MKKIKDFFKKFIWLWYMIGFVLIVALGIILKVKYEILYAVTGGILVVLGAFRIIPLIRTTDDKVLKWLNAVELGLNVIVGALLLTLALKEHPTSDDPKWIGKNFGYFLGGILTLRGLVYFYSTSLKKEDTTYFMFTFHIILFALGVIVLVKADWCNTNNLSWILFAIAMLSALFVGYGGIKGYIKYRNNEQQSNITKKMKIEIEEKNENETIESSDIVSVNIDGSKVEDSKSIQA